MATIKIKATHPSQGDYVIIEEENYDYKIHTLYEEKKEIKQVTTTRKPKK